MVILNNRHMASPTRFSKLDTITGSVENFCQQGRVFKIKN